MLFRSTIKRIIKILKDAGAKKIHIRIASPPVVGTKKYTIDIPEKEHLIAYNKTVEQIRQELGCDSLYYLSLDPAFFLFPTLIPIVVYEPFNVGQDKIRIRDPHPPASPKSPSRSRFPPASPRG